MLSQDGDDAAASLLAPMVDGSMAAARVAVRAVLAVVRMRWTEACLARGGRGTWTAVLGVGWVVLAAGVLLPRGASAEGPHAGAVYPATCTGGRSAPPLNPPGARR